MRHQPGKEERRGLTHDRQTDIETAAFFSKIVDTVDTHRLFSFLFLQEHHAGILIRAELEVFGGHDDAIERYVRALGAWRSPEQASGDGHHGHGAPRMLLFLAIKSSTQTTRSDVIVVAGLGNCVEVNV